LDSQDDTVLVLLGVLTDGIPIVPGSDLSGWRWLSHL
jgi:hypothetical protein